jgi:hypothetical protein
MADTPRGKIPEIIAARALRLPVGRRPPCPRLCGLAGRRCSVHPRAHGEEVHGPLLPHRLAGSPPCTRGGGVCRRWRSTPRPVHPRAHGEEGQGFSMSRDDDGGSPPCTRGGVRLWFLNERVERFTPVHTGRSTRPPVCQQCSQVHPRAHGEEDRRGPVLEALERFTPMHTGRRQQGFQIVARGSGSPPCTRGGNLSTVLPPAAYGSPPCIRGGGLELRGPSDERPVHPRVHGEEQGLLVFYCSFERFIPVHTGRSCRRTSGGHAEESCRPRSPPRAIGSPRETGAPYQKPCLCRCR